MVHTLSELEHLIISQKRPTRKLAADLANRNYERQGLL